MSAEVGKENPYEDYLTTGQAADILGVTPPRVHEFFYRGEFPTGIAIARYKFMRINEVLELKERRQREKEQKE